MTKRVHVAVGIIKSCEQILLAKRHGHLHQGGNGNFQEVKSKPAKPSPKL